jgi:hypothetical protein
VWKAAAKLPSLDGSSILFWLLVPLAGAVLWARLRGSNPGRLAGLLALTFVLTSVVIRFPWQKYVDPFALLIVLVSVRPREMRSPRLLLGAFVLAIAFVAYLLDTGAHRSATVNRVAVAPASTSPATASAAPRRDPVGGTADALRVLDPIGSRPTSRGDELAYPRHLL